MAVLYTLNGPIPWPTGDPPSTDDPDPALSSCGTDMLARGVAWQSALVKTHASQPMIYQVGHRKIAICAVPGRTLFRIDDGEGGLRMERTDLDVIVETDDLVLDGVPFTPERGHRVRRRFGDTIEVYEVNAPGGETPWRYSDPYRTRIRVHTTLVGTEDA